MMLHYNYLLTCNLFLTKYLYNSCGYWFKLLPLMCNWLFLLLVSALQWAHALHLPVMHKKGVTWFAGMMASDTASDSCFHFLGSYCVVWEMAIEPTACGRMATVWQMLYIQILVFYLMILNYSKRVLPTKVICFFFCKRTAKSVLHAFSIPWVKTNGFTLISCVTEQGSHLILAMVGLDHKIHIYCPNKSGKVSNLKIITTLFFTFEVPSCVYYPNLEFHFCHIMRFRCSSTIIEV
jgi:hypothetical protein